MSPTPLNPINPLGLDNSPHNLLSNGVPVNLSADQKVNYAELQREMSSLLASESVCHADGNLDKKVNQADVDGVLKYWGQPSWFDVNRDGTTDQMVECVMANLGNHCLVSGPGANCPTPTYLNNPTILPTGSFKFIFTGTPGTLYEVIATTNLSLLSSEWMTLGVPTETSPGRFQFEYSQAADRPSLHYKVRTP